MQRVMTICDKADAGVPGVLAGFAEGYRASLKEPETTDIANVIPADRAGVFEYLRRNAVYQNDPVCLDYMQSVGASMQRLAREGIFGDCGAYAVFVSALATRLGFGPGMWLLLGDANNPAQHIVNIFHLGSVDLVIDATQPNGYDWQIPAYFTSVQMIDPRTGKAV